MQSRVSTQGSVNAPTPDNVVGPLKVELLGLAKSTWNFQSCSAPLRSSSIRKLGEPAGGPAPPSRSEGSRLYSVVASVKHTRAGDAAPASIAVRANAQASGPRYDVP